MAASTIFIQEFVSVSAEWIGFSGEGLFIVGRIKRYRRRIRSDLRQRSNSF